MGREARPFTWRCETTLTQTTRDAAVGYAVAHALAARPIERATSSRLAMKIYRRAQTIDEWHGVHHGTSLLAGVRVAFEFGFLSGYRWALNLNDIILTVGYFGPMVLGIDWHEGMMKPDESGTVRREGAVVGQHAVLCTAVSLEGEGWLTLHNSWGPDWGRGGECRISFDDLGELFETNGEACLLLGHQRSPRVT